VRIERAVAWQEEQSPNPADAEALGKLLRERLKGAGIAPAPVLACVGRDRVVLKEIRHPPVPAADEPGLVRFQAIKELTDHPDEVVLDYVPAGDTGQGERCALVLSLRRELFTTYQALCKAAGLKLAALSPRPFGTALCLKHLAGTTAATPAPEPADAAVAVLTVAARWAEFCVVRGDRLLFARALAAPALSDDAALLGEIRRNLAVYAGQAGQQPVRALYIANGSQPGLLHERLRATLAIPVHMLDPFAAEQQLQLAVDNRGAFAGAVGLLHGLAAGRELPINFVQPREPKPPQDPNQRRIAIGAGIAALLVIGAIVFCYALLAGRDRELTNLALQQQDLDRQMAQTEEELRRLKALDDWDNGSIVWLDELYDLAERIPDINALRLSKVAGDPIPSTAKSKYVAMMTLEGSSSTEKHVDNLIAQLNRESPYHAHPPKRNTGPDRSRFTRPFTARVDLIRRPPSDYQRRLPAKAEPERKAPADQPFDFGFGLGGVP
jgi:Tfp pilus assembly PilM family ATPase